MKPAAWSVEAALRYAEKHGRFPDGFRSDVAASIEASRKRESDRPRGEYRIITKAPDAR